MNDNNKFEYTYSAPTEAERREIKNIRSQYEDKVETAESKLDRLRKLDDKVKNTSLAFALTFGIFFVLVLGLGMSCVLEFDRVLVGVILGVIGIIGVIINYPLYKLVLKKLKKKYGEEILKLTEELLGEKE